MNLAELKCFDCGKHPIVTIVCQFCSAMRTERDGESYITILMDEWTAKHPGAVPTKRVRKKDRVLRDWDDREVRLAK